MISFWCIYEYGYYENDLVAEKYEDKPRLSKSYQAYKHTVSWWQPWIWAVISGIIGILFLEASQLATSLFDWGWLRNTNQILDNGLKLMVYWLEFLLASRLCFWVYNYVNKKTRIWLYLVLQVTRYCGFLVVTAINIVGISALLSHIFTRSISYILYRYSGGTKKSWPDLPEKFIRFLLFLPMIIGLSIAESNFSIFFSWQTLAFILYFLVRSKKDTLGIIRQFKLINQDGTN